MIAVPPLVSEFAIVGRLEDFMVDSKARLKYLHISSNTEEYSIKVAKSKTNFLTQQLQLGCWLKVTGMRKYKLHQDELEYKAYKIELLSAQAAEQFTCDRVVTKVATTKAKAKVLFCQSSNCWNKGGKTAYKFLQAELRSQGMTDKVEIKTTGCMKQCKQAPNLVIMPGKSRYGRVQLQQISALVAKHLIEKIRD